MTLPAKFLNCALAGIALALSACVTIDDTFNNAAQMAERDCTQKGKRPVFTQSEVNNDFWRGQTVGLHSICVPPGDARYEHPGLQIMMNDSQDPPGARVALVIAGFAGAKCGLQRGDVILAMGDHSIANRDDVAKYAFVNAPTDVQITFMRGREKKTAVAHL